MNNIIGEGAYDTEGHKNTAFLEATEMGPYSHEKQRAWTKIRDEAIANYDIEGDKGSEQCDRLYPGA